MESPIEGTLMVFSNEDISFLNNWQRSKVGKCARAYVEG
jgi:hypothetical protein